MAADESILADAEVAASLVGDVRLTDNAPSRMAGQVAASMSIVQPEAAVQAITQTYAASKLDVYGPVRDFTLRMRVARLPGLAFGHVRFGTDVRVTAIPPSCYVVCFAPSGRLEVASNRAVHQVAGARGAVIYPHEATYFEKWGAGTELASLRIEDQYLERALVQLIGRPLREPIRFEPGFDLRNAQTAAFRRALQLLETELSGPGALAQNPWGGAVLAELVTTSLLLSQPNNYSEAIHEPVKSIPAGTIREAQGLIDADPMSISTISELSNRVYSSVRSLEEGFRKHLDTSPMAYLRQTRLARAHSDLQLADPSTCTVRRIANRWGFQHLGRFAQYHRDVFGELPAETLRSTRRKAS